MNNKDIEELYKTLSKKLNKNFKKIESIFLSCNTFEQILNTQNWSYDYLNRELNNYKNHISILYKYKWLQHELCLYNTYTKIIHELTYKHLNKIKTSKK
ncbi:MAG: hypothetical protein RSE41_02930 [Clostridia bacterium]